MGTMRTGTVIEVDMRNPEVIRWHFADEKLDVAHITFSDWKRDHSLAADALARRVEVTPGGRGPNMPAFGESFRFID